MNKTEKDGILRITQEGGKTLAWWGDSGVELLKVDGLYFKDLAKCGKLLPYEDWRLSVEERAQDLAGRLSVEEIAGLMLYSPHQRVPGVPFGPFVGTYDGKSREEAGAPEYALTDQQKEFLDKEHIRHILLITVDSAACSARWSNELQKAAEKAAYGIPVNISSDPRNGANADTGAEFKSSGSDVSKWPEGIGFAASFDPAVTRQFAEDASREYRALGITTALGPQIDLSTEPRWFRFPDTLGLDLETTKKLTKAYCDGMQTTPGESDGWGKYSVNTMVKHWPGGGTGEGGRDAHYSFGEFAVYPGGKFEEHIKPFTEAAFHLDGPTGTASAVMPYYTISYNVDQKNGKNVGNSYSEYLIKDLLREKYGYQGVVCTDWSITDDPNPGIDGFMGGRCYGVQDLSVAERHLLCIMNGVDQFGGNSQSGPIIEAYKIGCQRYGEEAMRARYERSAIRLLTNIFRCGLFEDPYLDPEESEKIVGCQEFYEHGYRAQQKSIVLLKNRDQCIPQAKGQKVYVPTRHIGPSKGFMRDDVPAMDIDPLSGGLPEEFGIRVDNPQDADLAICFVSSPSCNPYDEADLAKGGNGYFPVTLQYRPYTATAARSLSIAGGDPREDFTNRSYLGKTNTAYNESDLDLILDTKKAMGHKPVIVVATMSNPMIVSEFESEIDGLIAEFGVSRQASLDVVFGNFHPTGRLPIQIPANMETVEHHCEDVAFDLECHVDEAGNTYDYGFGLQA